MHFFDANDGPKIDETSASNEEASDNDNELSPILLDASLDPFVPVEADQHAEKSLLRFSRDQLPIDPAIAHFPRHGKLPHSEMRYKRNYTPKEQPEGVEILLQDPSPELKAAESEPTVNKEPTKRSSCRKKKQPERFAGNMETMWKAGKAFKSYTSMAATLRILLLPTVITAVPLAGLVDLGIEPATIFPDATLLHPIDPSVAEQLRAYHSRLDV